MGKATRVKQKRRRRWWVILSLVGLVAAGLGVAFLTSSDDGSLTSSSRPRAPGDQYETLRPGELPSFAEQASVKVQETYRYAAAHPEVLQYIPCTCGCRHIGHRHNGDCYVQERLADGRITFTSHAAT
jgi:hypothetical protein